MESCLSLVIVNCRGIVCSFSANLKGIVYTVSHHPLDEAWSDQSVISLYVIHSRSKLFWRILRVWCRLRPKWRCTLIWANARSGVIDIMWLEPQSISSTNEGPRHSCDQSVMCSYISNKTVPIMTLAESEKLFEVHANDCSTVSSPALFVVSRRCVKQDIPERYTGQSVNGSTTLRGLAWQPGYFQRVKGKSFLFGMPFTCHLDSGLLS